MAANDDREQDLETRTRAAVAAATAGVSDATLIRALGVSRQTVRNYKNAAVTIPLDTAAALAAHLKLTVDQLAGAAPLPSRSPELLSAAQALQEIATAQEGVANTLQDVAALLLRHGGQADDAQAGTG